MHRPVTHRMCPCSSSQASRTGLSDDTHRSRLSNSGAVFFIISMGLAPRVESVTIDCVTLGFGKNSRRIGSAREA